MTAYYVTAFVADEDGHVMYHVVGDLDSEWYACSIAANVSQLPGVSYTEVASGEGDGGWTNRRDVARYADGSPLSLDADVPHPSNP